MDTLEAFRNEAFVQFCYEQLKSYAREYDGIESVLLATPDGFDIAMYDNANTEAERLSAVGSSLFALGSSLIKEFEMKNCKSIILDSEEGKIYIASIAGMRNSLILVVKSDRQAMLANVIHGVKKLTVEISSKLDVVA